MPEIEAALLEADLFVAIGTSGTVYPAAGFALQARTRGARTVEINLEASAPATGTFDENIEGNAVDTVPLFVERLLRSRAGR